MEHLPWLVKIALYFGAGVTAWKMIQGRVPAIIAWLTPLALKATDAAVAMVLAYPLLRWAVLGDEENTEKFLNALIDGIQGVIDAVQKRLIEDLRAAKTPPPPQQPS